MLQSKIRDSLLASSMTSYYSGNYYFRILAPCQKQIFQEIINTKYSKYDKTHEKEYTYRPRKVLFHAKLLKSVLQIHDMEAHV